MGLCSSCLKGSSTETDYTTPDMEIRRQQQLEAAEKRRQEQENRGIKDPERVKRMQQKAEDLEKLERQAALTSQGGGMKWQVS